MWYKLPIKERMELMRTYKKGGYSYSDMVSDYNTSYEQFGNGGKKGEDKPKPSPYLPIQTYNPSETTNQPDLATRYNAPNEHNRLSKTKLAMIEGQSKGYPTMQADTRSEAIKEQDKVKSDKIQRKIDNPLIYNPAGTIASYLTRFEGMSPEEVAYTDANISGSLEYAGDRLGEALVNEMVGGAGNKLIGKSIDYANKTIKPNMYKINPYAKGNKLNPWDKDAYYRIAGSEAAEDAISSGVVRSKPGAPAKMFGDTKINLGSRPTEYPSFAKSEPSMEYAKSLDNHVLIETTRPMKASTLGRHGKGTTQFPTGPEGNYLREFPTKEAKIYEPHWWKGYKEIKQPINTSKPVLGPKPLPKELEPYISSKQLKATREEEIYESFLSNEARSKKSAARTIKYDKNGNKIN